MKKETYVNEETVIVDSLSVAEFESNIKIYAKNGAIENKPAIGTLANELVESREVFEFERDLKEVWKKICYAYLSNKFEVFIPSSGLSIPRMKEYFTKMGVVCKHKKSILRGSNLIISWRNPTTDLIEKIEEKISVYGLSKHETEKIYNYFAEELKKCACQCEFRQWTPKENFKFTNFTESVIDEKIAIYQLENCFLKQGIEVSFKKVVSLNTTYQVTFTW